MNRVYWQRIQRNYPNALQQCMNHFKGRSTKWRSEIQKSENLIKFFERCKIELIITKSAKYGFEIRTYYISIKYKPKWSNRQNAVWWGIEYAFKVLEQKKLGNIYEKPFEKPDPARNKNKTSGNDWGKQQQK